MIEWGTRCTAIHELDGRTVSGFSRPEGIAPKLVEDYVTPYDGFYYDWGEVADVRRELDVEQRIKTLQAEKRLLYTELTNVRAEVTRLRTILETRNDNLERLDDARSENARLTKQVQDLRNDLRHQYITAAMAGAMSLGDEYYPQRTVTLALEHFDEAIRQLSTEADRD